MSRPVHGPAAEATGPVEAGMGVGAGIFLIAIGAILTFAVKASLSGIDIKVIGVILMVTGVIGIVLDLVMFAPRRRVTRTETRSAPGVQSTVREEDPR